MAAAGEKRSHGAAFDAAGEKPETEEATPARVDMNPFTGTPYSRRFYELLERRQKLPAWAARDELLQLLRANQVVLLVGEPGSGKTTQLPQILLDAGYHDLGNGRVGALACCQPHGVAASSAAQRVSEELEVGVGTYVGHLIPFEDKTSSETLLKFLTDDLMLWEMLSDQSLERYSVVILDEVHERTLTTDLLLGLFRRLLKQRPEFKLLISASSMDVQVLQSFFDGAPLLTLPGRTHAVEVFYLPEPEKDYLQAALRVVAQIHTQEPEGDILLFLATDEEVNTACGHLRIQSLRLAEAGSELAVVPLHGALPAALQLRLFDAPPPARIPGGKVGRRCIVATGMAESAVALENIAYVVDPGLSRQRAYNPRTRIEACLVSPISRRCAQLRARRAGRVRAGKCYRLYTEKVFQEELTERDYPEILRAGLSAAVLALKKLGVDDVVHFDFVDPPSPEALMRAFETLHDLGFMDDDGDLTAAGEQAVRFQVPDPQLAKMLIEAPNHKCSNEALSIAAMLSAPPAFTRAAESPAARKAADEARGRFAHLDGDHLTLLNAFHAYKQQVQDNEDPTKFCADNFIDVRAMKTAEIARDQYKKTMEQLGLQLVSTDFQDKEYYPNIRRCLVAGFFLQVARLAPMQPDKEKEKSSKKEVPAKYLTVRDSQPALMHPLSCLRHKPEWVLYHELALTSKTHLRTVTQIRGEWLLDIAPAYYDVAKLPKTEARVALEKVIAKRKGLA